MHVLFFTPAFPPFIGGGERYARSLAMALTAREQRVTVITSQARREQELWQGTGVAAGVDQHDDGPLTVIRCPLRPVPGGWRGLLLWRKAMVLLSMLPGDQSRLLEGMARSVPRLAQLEEALARMSFEPNVVHAFNLSWEHTLLAARDFAQQRALPLVITPFAHFGSASRQRARRARVARNATMDHQRRLLSQARAVLALTSVECEGFAQWNIAPRRVVVAGGGVDQPPHVPDGAAVVQKYELKAPFVLFVGRANHDKGAIHAAQATLQLAQMGFPLTLALVGRAAPDFQQYVSRLDSASRRRLRLLGALDEASKHALMQEASMLLLPSQAESFGIVMLEAWQHGTPVVAARAGGIASVVDHNENGLLVPFGDVPALAAAMQRLLEDEALGRAMGRRGQEKVQRQYTWEQVANRVLAVYNEVTA